MNQNSSFKNEETNIEISSKYAEEDFETDPMHSIRQHDDGESIWLMSYADLMTLLFSFFALLMSFSKLDVEQFEKVRKETTEVFGGEYSKPFEKLSKDLNGSRVSQGLSDQVFISQNSGGIQITFRGALFFDSGSASLKAEAKNILDKFIPLVQKQNKIFEVIIEGHTDDNPIADSRFPSNWELSSARATSVLKVFEQNGFPRDKLRAIGYADTHPVLPNRDENGKAIAENQTQNRRVVIKLTRENVNLNNAKTGSSPNP